MGTFTKKKWLKVIEFAVVGLATWVISYSEISEFSSPAPKQVTCAEERIRRSETTDQQRQFLLFLLKLCFQILVALQKAEDQPSSTQQAQPVLLIKLCLQILASL